MTSKLIISLILIISSDYALFWQNHDISTLKALIVVFRNGERTPTEFVPNDPFKNLEEYWPEGLSTLTNLGKYRMFKVGQLVNNEYKKFLGDVYSPRDVYVRSSISHRNLESANAFTAGAFPPTKQWQWDISSDAQIGQIWQPIAVETMPQVDDIVLTSFKKCPNVDKEIDKIVNSVAVKNYLNMYTDFLANITKVTATKLSAHDYILLLADTLAIELERNLKWADKGVMSDAYERSAFEIITKIGNFFWGAIYNSSIVNRVRGGPLLNTIINNIINVTLNESMRKVFVYSTHDDPLAALMGELGVFNQAIVPYDATLFIELHNQSVKLFFFNSTTTETSPYSLQMPKCGNAFQCPIDTFIDMAKSVIPNNWTADCGI